MAANRRYFAAFAAVDNPAKAQQQLAKLDKAKKRKGRRYRGFNPAMVDDVDIIAAVLRGEHAIRGFRNQDIRVALLGNAATPKTRLRHSRKVSRLLKTLQVHSVIAKIPRSRRWRTTERGQPIMTMALKYHRQDYVRTLTETQEADAA